MASLQAKIDAVKAAVASTASCTPATVVTLKELLLPEAEAPATKTKTPARGTKTPTGTRTKKAAGGQQDELLSSRDRTVLATHVINVTIKSLAAAAKPPVPSTPVKRKADAPRSAAKTLRRSLSTPLSPLPPRTLNRVATSPIVTTKTTKPLAPSQSTGCLATVECARTAFAALRALKGPIQADQTEFQLETGMSALVGKLLALKLHDQALKELRVLKRRLDTTISTETTKIAKSAAGGNAEASSSLSDLLAFHGTPSTSSLSIVTTCQLQLLKLIVATKKPAHIEAVLPVLVESHASSPVNLLSRLAKEVDNEAATAARQMASLSQILLSLAPSVSSQEDSVATELRLSPSPVTAFQLQALAFRVQLRWWKLAGHKGSVDNDIISPFTRCIRSFARRQTSDEVLIYTTLSTSFDELMQLITSQKHQPTTSSKSPLASIYQLLGTTAQAARRYDDAQRWFQNLKDSLSTEDSTSVRICSASARLLSVALKRTELDSGVEQLLGEVIDGLDGSLSGTVAELKDLLDSLSLSRRSIVGILMNILGPNAAPETVSETLGEHLKTFIRRYPRFVRRWMGTPPAKDAPAKQVVQFDQRRQLVTQSINQVLDATLMVVKCDIQSGTSEWQSVDDVLQHCDSLLGSVADPALSISRTEQLGGYRVKISSLYFSRFAQLRKESNRSKEANKELIQSLNRSIDLVKDCTPAEKEKAQLSTKLELYADLCKGAGRASDAVQTLRSVCTNMAEDGVLLGVATALASQPPVLAWAMDEKATTLSRTLRSIAKLDRSWNDWTFFLAEAERAAVLEHLMHISSDSSSSPQALGLHDPGVAALLRIYTLEKYPVRRLRVLLHILCQNLGDQDGTDAINDLLEQALRQVQKKDKAEDSSLSNYIPHLEAYYASISALSETNTDSPTSVMEDAISSWKSMIETCKTREDLYTIIDDCDGLLRHLQSLNQLAGLRGENHLQLAISDLSIKISQAFGECAELPGDELIVNHSRLATQYVQIGMFAQALKTLEQTKDLLGQHDGISRRVVADFCLAEAEYFAGVGKADDAMNCISKASDICNEPHSSWAQSKSQATMMLAMVSFLQSTVAIQAGDIQDALSCIKLSVRMLSHDWAKLEAPALTTSGSGGDAGFSESTISNSLLKAPKSRLIGPRFWNLASPLLRSLLHISSVYAHIGMFQETIYYADSAWKIAENTQSSLYKSQVSAWTSSVYLKAGRLDKALSICNDARDSMPREVSSSRVRFASQLGDIYRELGENEKAFEFLKIAEETARLLSGTPASLQSAENNEEVIGAVPQTKTKAVAKTPRATRATRAKTPTAPKPVKRAPVAKSKARATPTIPELPKDVHQSSLLAAIILSRAVGFIQQKDWSSALSTLEAAKDLPKLFGTLSQEQVIMATTLIGHSMEQMISDPVFSVMQDSTISLPAISAPSERILSDKASLTVSPPRKGRATAAKGLKERVMPAFAEALKQAQELLMGAHATAISTSDSNMVHRISTLLQSTIILLSATSTTKSKAIVHSGLATVAVDLARNITWKREQQTLSAGNDAAVASELLNSSMSSSTSRRSSLGFTTDMAKFQKNYVEMVPKSWSVISVSLSDNRHDLCITKFQAGYTPFILRLPLERANSRDADSEVFNFEDGREELLDVVKLANETSHSARDFTVKGERGAWWAEREELDHRLKDLLVTIETTWLGGFKGIFSQHRHRPELLARFQKSFHQILDGSLPSRTKVRGKKTSKAPTVTLDLRILELFIGLGDPTDPDGDYDEALNDLLYFVVDILQFHGERNAYDEIDFDAMVVETYDALRGYYDAAAKCGAEREDDAHTVLVLDKALHTFPWESLPCMEGLSVSRVPSLACLKQLISEAQGPTKQASGEDDAVKPSPEGHYVSAKSGTYILNPSSDLKNTQSFFQPSFSSLESWTSIVNRVPEEADFEQALSTSEVVLYFGHGSGAQYVRGKTIRRLDKCRPATFLMGCSSAALTEVGGFECYGPVWNYMMAGCPAVVGTLWDVTDRDIDRFAGRAFEEWGLFPRGTFKENKKGKGRDEAPGNGAADDEESSLDEGEGTADLSLAAAVAKARGVCRFKYLNAAAVVLYGIPVYIKRE